MELINKQRSKQGSFFSVDAFIALLIIIGVLLVIRPPSTQTSLPLALQGDILESLSFVTIGEIDDPVAQNLILQGDISDTNLSVIEQIGEFYAVSDPNAELLAESILNSLDFSHNIGIYFNGKAVALKNDTPIEDATEILTSRQLISGISEGSSVTGYSSRAFLLASNDLDYYYFGGYIGDGNITLFIGDDLSSVEVEAVFSGDFDVYVNDIYLESHSPPQEEPYIFNLTDDIGSFSSEDNELSFRSQNTLYIAGGYVKVGRDHSGNITTTKKIYLPGIEGLINLYDGFFVPGNLTFLEVYLHYASNHSLFMNLGNTTIYNGSSGGAETTVTIDDATLSSLYDYDALSHETLPLRMGLENVSYQANETLEADVLSVTDLSGSMAPTCNGGNFWCCLFSGGCTTEPVCSSCGGTYEDKLSEAKLANDVFIDSILNGTENKVGLVGYKESVSASDTHSLSEDTVSLKAEVSSWNAGGSTCICCGINSARDMILNESINGTFQSMVVMSDGEANIECSEQGTGSATQDAIQAACDAYDYHGIRVYSVGFGSSVDETTLQSISSCGQGSYYYGDVADLVEVYEQIAIEIINASYFEQTISAENLTTTLYPDSYISLVYNTSIPYGLTFTVESEPFGNSSQGGLVTIPNDTTLHELNVLSYSGSRWTDTVDVNTSATGYNWQTIFDLSLYGDEYIYLGDPYVVNVPTSFISQGDNYVTVNTALSSSGNSTLGSSYNKAVYTLVKEIISYSPIVSVAEGCTWVIEFEDTTNQTVKAPYTYNGTNTCSYTSSLVSYNPNDAIDIATYNLFEELDFDLDRRIDAKFSAEEISLTSSEITGIPFTWDTEVQVRIWR